MSDIEGWAKMCAGKTKFHSIGVAEKCIKRLVVTEKKVPFMRWYSCPHCFGIHITSTREAKRA